MSENLRSVPNADLADTGSDDHRPPMGSSLAALVALVCIALAIGVVDLLVQGQDPSLAAAMASWNWVVNLVLVILAIVIVLMVLRTVIRGVGMIPRESSWERRGRRHGHDVGPQYHDPAVNIARERYARGEITQDQLDQTLRQLGKGV